MSGKAIQGSFPGGQPKLPPPIPARTAARPPSPPGTASAARPPGPLAPAFGGRHGAVQRHGAGGAFAVEAGYLGLASGGGQPLPEMLRGKMEAAIGANFSDVRVHVGLQAERIGAIAFTIGSDIYFAPGRYQPDTVQGRQLLGHELTHVVQQRTGRVRNPFGSGVAVVQDRSLEVEAERLGAKAALQRGPVPPKTASVLAKQTKTGPGGNHGSKAGFRPQMIQRTIHQFKNGAWQVAELGTRGSHGLPVDGQEGEYFNDLNNKRSEDIDEVRAGLSDLMMITGSLTDKKIGLSWPADLLAGLKGLVQNPGGDVVILGKVTLSAWTPPPARLPVLPPPPAPLSPQTLPAVLPPPLSLPPLPLPRHPAPSPFRTNFTPRGPRRLRRLYFLQRVWNQLLRSFMENNGQLPYICRQSWFINHEAEVDVEVQFYWNRGYDAGFAFHKDTAGDNLFVNLIFTNEDIMPATEWIEDLADPLKQKCEAMTKLMPRGMIDEINNARQRIRSGDNQPWEKGTIRGGIAGKAAFVSWVDDLVWHATPVVESRKEIQIDMYELLNSPGTYWQQKLPVHKALHYLSTFSDTLIAQYMSQPGEEWKLTTHLVDRYIWSVVPPTGGQGSNYLRHMQDVQRHKHQLEVAPPPLGIGQELAPEDLPPRGIGTAEFNQPTGILGRTTRANSFGGSGPEPVFRPHRGDLLEEAKRRTPIRSFLRTWVRVRKV